MSCGRCLHAGNCTGFVWASSLDWKVLHVEPVLRAAVRMIVFSLSDFYGPIVAEVLSIPFNPVDAATKFR